MKFHEPMKKRFSIIEGMDEIIQIKCPFDGAVLSVRNQPGIESKNVTCPVCKKKFPFTQYRRVSPASNINDETDTGSPLKPGCSNTCKDTGQYTVYSDFTGDGKSADDEDNRYNSLNFSIGRMTVLPSGMTFQLKFGRNVIGRKALHSKADFQIDTGEGRAMSREHLVIDVKKEPGRGFVHYVSLYKERVNKTMFCAEPLLYGDCMVLHNGEIIELPDSCFLKFEIEDLDKTQI